MVYVAQSHIPGAGEGLYAKQFIPKGQLVALFNGLRHFKDGHATTITADHPDWSDYRLMLGTHAVKKRPISNLPGLQGQNEYKSKNFLIPANLH